MEIGHITSCQALDTSSSEGRGTVERLMPNQLQQSTAAGACPDGADGYLRQLAKQHDALSGIKFVEFVWVNIARRDWFQSF